MPFDLRDDERLTSVALVSRRVASDGPRLKYDSLFLKRNIAVAW